ncbi:HD-GYP domain-containing protein [Paenibacillus cremeus]|uniref:HD-GYP domain-containing protein n=1 Tax=Paenibacillus cremeus TaxID=2163881 RepID=A0A559K9Z7_9BACL|nr:HD-GYP domain-containing protein [Paenibacillus cremeus]TVY08944.1 HD-GYP domain-containing protein [Paenibacillus cremeus]
MGKTKEVNPYRRFTWTLGISVILIGLVLSAVTLWASSSFVIRETVDLTNASVVKHFIKLPQLADLFGGKGTQSTSGDKGRTAASSYEGDSHAGHMQPAASGSSGYEHAGSEGYEEHALPKDYEGVYNVVRMHFDLYSIVETNFYYPDGTINFSYDKSRVGQKASTAAYSAIDQVVEKKEVLHDRMSGHRLHLWLPIQGEGNRVNGVVEIVRDITEQDLVSSWLQVTLLTVILIGMLALFFGLRQVFVYSTRIIDGKNKELNAMIDTIERTYDESLQALSSALDSRDNETQGHSFRVTAYATRLAMEMRLSDEDLGLLARGALLHDVGKIGVPDAILLKPDKLTEDEWVVMKRHVQLGHQMLQHIAFLQPSLDVVLYHHERVDGRGYPFGLQGEEIPLFARIFSLCDTYDAITSDRPYRKGRGYLEARAEIERCTETQFCPMVVEAFLRIPPEDWQEIQEISRVAHEDEVLDRLRFQRSGRQAIAG